MLGGYRETATEKKLGKVFLNPKCVKEVSSVEAEQDRPSSGLREERLNDEHHFSDRKEIGQWPVRCVRETMQVFVQGLQQKATHTCRQMLRIAPHLWRYHVPPIAT
jgi:hypothetical protein